MNSVVNVAGYKFVHLDRLPQRRDQLLEFGRQLKLKGTVLLSREGINLFLAGSREGIDEFLRQLRRDSCLADFQVKQSLSAEQPFTRLLVRIKREIIACGVSDVCPEQKTSPKIKPRQLKQWLDAGKPVTLLDVRNDYEVELGTFRSAVAANIGHFRQFPDAIHRIPLRQKGQPIVMFCTGGIRCEKAGPLMESAGFESVFQLEGGILQYFEDCGGAHFQGECFVFDKRVALNSRLQETDTTICYACQHVLTPMDLDSPQYRPGISCPYCYQTLDQSMSALIEQRHRDIGRATTPLPGCQPYDNVRPLHVPARYDRHSLIDFLCQFHPHVPRETWREKISMGRFTCQQRTLKADDRVRGGQRIEHLIPATTEPAVNPNIQIVHEDRWLVVVNKPAPLPMHPSGRFNRNTLMSILNAVYPRPLCSAHRLDANTSGLVVLAKRKKTATKLQLQFERREVEKTYMARVHGELTQDRFVLRHHIADQPVLAGARRVAANGKSSDTEVQVLDRLGDGTTLLRVSPRTGRTNQIRVHLWQEGHPVVGDPTFGIKRQMFDKQTLDVGDPPMCLHAWRLSFRHPETDQPVSFQSQLRPW